MTITEWIFGTTKEPKRCQKTAPPPKNGPDEAESLNAAADKMIAVMVEQNAAIAKQNALLRSIVEKVAAYDERLAKAELESAKQRHANDCLHKRLTALEDAEYARVQEAKR